MKSSIVSLGLLFIILVIIIVPSVSEVINRRDERLVYAVTSKIVNTALDCYNKDVCKETKITLKELYNLKLLDKQADPKTLEYYDENSYVLIDKKEFVKI